MANTVPLIAHDRQAALAELRGTITKLARGRAALDVGCVSLCPSIDQALPGRGLARAACHEVLADESGAATGFCALILARTAGAVVWIGSEPDVWPDGLSDFGLQPTDLILVAAKRPKDGFWAFEEALRSPGVAGAVLVVDGPAPSLVATRRFQLAAEAGGGIGLLVMPDTDRRLPSAARSRWRVGSAPTACAGHPAWHLALLRVPGGRPGAWTVTWDRTAQALRLACPLRPASSCAAGASA